MYAGMPSVEQLRLRLAFATQALRAVVDERGTDVGARELGRGVVELLPGAACGRRRNVGMQGRRVHSHNWLLMWLGVHAMSSLELRE